MSRVKRCCVGFYRLATFAAVAFTISKLVRHWHAGLAEKTGHAIDASVRAAAEKLEKTAIALEEWGENGMGENLGKGLDDVLVDTQKALEMATDLVQRALSHA
jgi:hypothetical protein